MRAAGITKFGGRVTALDVSERRSLAPDEIRIAVAAAGVGNWDEFVRTESWNVGIRPPMALGVEGAGVILEVGSSSRGLAVGDEVLTHAVPLLGHGFWAEEAIVKAALIAPKPHDVTWRDAATLPVPALVAQQVLSESLRVGADDSLLVNGGGGTTGGIIVQLAAARKMTVVATAGSASADRVRRLGADTVLDYKDPRWPEVARQIIGREGFTAGVNAARNGAAATLKAIADGGQLATITGDPPPTERGITIRDVYVRPDARQLSALARLLAHGKLALPVGVTYPLEDAARALELSVSGRSGGAVALMVSDSEPIP
jgi:NADPH:quinone reductase-like Zn-dependent oxidoreductase